MGGISHLDSVHLEELVLHDPEQDCVGEAAAAVEPEGDRGEFGHRGVSRPARARHKKCIPFELGNSSYFERIYDRARRTRPDTRRFACSTTARPLRCPRARPSGIGTPKRRDSSAPTTSASTSRSGSCSSGRRTAGCEGATRGHQVPRALEGSWSGSGSVRGTTGRRRITRTSRRIGTSGRGGCGGPSGSSTTTDDDHSFPTRRPE